MSSNARLIAMAFASATVIACLDPLYEEGAPVDAPVTFCCLDVVAGVGLPYTCQRVGTRCIDAPSCLLPAYACVSGGRCTTRTCHGSGGGSGTGGGMGSGGGGGASGGGGGFSDAGWPPVDAGVVDAGTQLDGGTPPDAGVEPQFEVCCLAGRVATCACPGSGCGQSPLTLCPRGACVEGASSHCP